jgi:hypothetical protein
MRCTSPPACAAAQAAALPPAHVRHGHGEAGAAARAARPDGARRHRDDHAVRRRRRGRQAGRDREGVWLGQPAGSKADPRIGAPCLSNRDFGAIGGVRTRDIQDLQPSRALSGITHPCAVRTSRLVPVPPRRSASVGQQMGSKAVIRPIGETLRMPPDSCKRCGDGTEPGHELCSACEKQATEAQRPRIPGDNWRASLGFRRYRRR